MVIEAINKTNKPKYEKNMNMKNHIILSAMKLCFVFCPVEFLHSPIPHPAQNKIEKVIFKNIILTLFKGYSLWQIASSWIFKN